MSESTELTLRPTAALDSPRSRYLSKMQESRLRLDQAMARVRQRAHEMTPAARIQAHPGNWILGGLLVGLTLGLLTGGRRRR